MRITRTGHTWTVECPQCHAGQSFSFLDVAQKWAAKVHTCRGAK